MTSEDLLAELSAATSRRRLSESLSRHTGEQLADDLRFAVGGQPMGLWFAKHLPLTEHPPRLSPRWNHIADDSHDVAETVNRLDVVVDSLTNPLMVCRIADLLWSELPKPRRDFDRHARRALEAYDAVARLSPDMTDRLAAIWAGSELALELNRPSECARLRGLTADCALALVSGEAPPSAPALELDSGLMYLYGIAMRWDDLPIARELLVIAEIAERRVRPLAFPGMTRPAIDWIHRIRYLAASSDAERVRVVEELIADRRAAAASWPDFGDGAPPVMEVGELSRAIEDVADVAARLGQGTLRGRLERLTRDLVVELQNLGWTYNVTRPSLVSPEDVSADARSAEVVWTAEAAGAPDSIVERLTWLASRPSPLRHPAGFDEASVAHRANVGRFRGQVRAYGFVAPDTLAGDLHQLAYAEMARHRMEVWGHVVAGLLTSADTDGRPVTPDIFSGPLVSDAIAERLAHGTSLFLQGDFDAAAHVVLPRLEHLIRRVAVARQVPALQVAYQSLGNVSYLAALLLEISKECPAEDQDRWEFLRLVLVDGQAGGIRNVLSHGLRSDSGLAEPVSGPEAALLIYTAALLAGADPGGGLPSPVSAADTWPQTGSAVER